MSNKPTSAHPQKEIITHFQTLTTEQKKQAYNLISIMAAEKAGRDIRTLLVIDADDKNIYTGNSIDVAATIYIQLLDQAITLSMEGIQMRINFYGIDKDDNKFSLERV